MKIKNKRGMEKIVGVYWFVILVLVASGFFAAVFTFYNSPYDVRELEANILINRVSDCLSNKGKLNERLFGESGEFSGDFKSDFMNECHLNFDTGKEFDNKVIQYFVKVNFYDFNEFEDFEKSNPLDFEIVEGNKNLQADCNIQENKEYGRIAKCAEKTFYSLGNGGGEYFVKIFSIIKKTEKNAS